jgi:hypothetical protein
MTIKNKSKLILFLVITAACLGFAVICLAETDRPPLNKYSISELNKDLFTFGTYEIEGYVVKAYSCPPCPQGAQCKVCMPENIVVSQELKEFDSYVKLTENDLIIFVEDAKVFKIGVKYKFLIQIMDVKSTNQPLNNIKLIYYEEIKQNKTEKEGKSKKN